ncbi:hypothetical protein D3C76_1357860 [compost metagenome]
MLRERPIHKEWRSVRTCLRTILIPRRKPFIGPSTQHCAGAISFVSKRKSCRHLGPTRRNSNTCFLSGHAYIAIPNSFMTPSAMANCSMVVSVSRCPWAPPWSFLCLPSDMRICANGCKSIAQISGPIFYSTQATTLETKSAWVFTWHSRLSAMSYCESAVLCNVSYKMSKQIFGR